MVNQQLKSELEALKAQVEQISKHLETDQTKTVGDSDGKDAEESNTSTFDEVRRIANEFDAPHLAHQAADYLKALGHDVHDSKPRALVAAFLAGFIAGKMVGR